MNELIDWQKHTHLVYQIMKTHGIYSDHPIFKDVEQCGMIALAKACNTYISGKSNPSTYLYWPVRKSIQTEISNLSHCVRFKNMHSMCRASCNDKTPYQTLSLNYEYGNHNDDTTGNLLSMISFMGFDSINPLNILEDKEFDNYITSNYKDIIHTYCHKYKLHMDNLNVILCLFKKWNAVKYKDEYQLLLDNINHFSHRKYPRGIKMRGSKLITILRDIVKSRLKNIAKAKGIKWIV